MIRLIDISLRLADDVGKSDFLSFLGGACCILSRLFACQLSRGDCWLLVGKNALAKSLARAAYFQVLQFGR